ncbi:RhuM family protein [Pseudoflavonifractor sp.]
MSIAKNYLSKEGLQPLERIVTMYLDYAEYQASRNGYPSRQLHPK